MGLISIIADYLSGTQAGVDVNHNLRVTTPQVTSRLGGDVGTPNSVGATRIFCEKDSGSMSGTAYLQSPNCSDDARLSVAVDTPVFFDTFTEIEQNTGIWRYLSTTMSITIGGGFLLINANTPTSTSMGCQYTTWATFPLYGNNAIHMEIIGAITGTPQVGQIFEVGFFPLGPTAYSAPTEGCFFRLESAGLVGVIVYNGSETVTGLLVPSSSLLINYNNQFKIIVSQRKVEFWMNNAFLGNLDVPDNNNGPFMTGALPISFHQRNVGTISGAQMQVKIASVHIDQLMNYNRSMAEICCSYGLMGSQGQDGGTMGSTALLTNSASAAAAALANTFAAAQFTGLGGLFLVLPTLTVNSDGILCSYQVPVGGINQTPRRLVIRGVTIRGVVQTTLIGGPVIYAYSLAYGHTAVSMITVNTPSFVNSTTKAPRRIPIGMQSFVDAATAGVSDTPIFMQFLAPIYVNPGEFVAVAVRNLGVVTTGGVIAFTVGFDANWE